MPAIALTRITTAAQLHEKFTEGARPSRPKVASGGVFEFTPKAPARAQGSSD